MWLLIINVLLRDWEVSGVGPLYKVSRARSSVAVVSGRASDLNRSCATLVVSVTMQPTPTKKSFSGEVTSALNGDNWLTGHKCLFIVNSRIKLHLILNWLLTSGGASIPWEFRWIVHDTRKNQSKMDCNVRHDILYPIDEFPATFGLCSELEVVLS